MSITMGAAKLENVAIKGYEWLMDNAVVRNANGTLGWNHTVNVCSLNSTASYDVRPPLSHDTPSHEPFS